jgi:hypothetical protein
LELQKKNSESSVPKLPPLGNNGLIERPKTRGGMAFDITFCPETGNMRKAQLPKLERRKKKKKLTKEELEEKMRKATERRQVRKWLLTLMVTHVNGYSLWRFVSFFNPIYPISSIMFLSYKVLQFRSITRTSSD